MLDSVIPPNLLCTHLRTLKILMRKDRSSFPLRLHNSLACASLPRVFSGLPHFHRHIPKMKMKRKGEWIHRTTLVLKKGYRALIKIERDNYSSVKKKIEIALYVPFYRYLNR